MGFNMYDKKNRKTITIVIAVILILAMVVPALISSIIGY